MRYHLNCILLSSEEINDIKDNQQTWFCSPCIAEVFPFNQIEDDVEFVATIEDITVSGTAMCYLSEKVFIPFELNDKDHSSLLCDPDPDLHYFKSFNQVIANNNYFTETSFKEHINKCWDKDAFSMCHLNIRSISKNLCSFETYLDFIRYNFTIIGLTETWLNDTNYDTYGLLGYHFIEQQRSSTGGGVALCIMKHLNYIERPDLTFLENDMASLFVKINKKTVVFWKNIIIGVLYCPPKNDLSTFNDELESILQK